jgi:hypothetical protein
MVRARLVIASLSLIAACMQSEAGAIQYAGGTETGDGDGDGDVDVDVIIDHESEGDGDGDGDGDGEAPSCEENDAWEANDSPNGASAVNWDYMEEYGAAWTIDAFLCSEEEDWYYVAVEQLTYDYYGLFVRATVEGSGWCGADCGDPFLPVAEENTIAVDVFDAQSKMLLIGSVSPKGRLYLTSGGVAFSNDLLVRVSGPTPLASYGYQLNVEIRGYEGEDECEC